MCVAPFGREGGGGRKGKNEILQNGLLGLEIDKIKANECFTKM